MTYQRLVETKEMKIFLIISGKSLPDREKRKYKKFVERRTRKSVNNKREPRMERSY